MDLAPGIQFLDDDAHGFTEDFGIPEPFLDIPFDGHFQKVDKIGDHI